MKYNIGDIKIIGGVEHIKMMTHNPENVGEYIITGYNTRIINGDYFVLLSEFNNSVEYNPTDKIEVTFE